MIEWDGAQLRNELGTVAFIFAFVDVLHKNTLVLEYVTLAFQVQLVVQMTINLLCFTVFAQQAAKNTLTTHPDNLNGHTGIRSTFTFTKAGVASLGTGSLESDSAGTRVYNRGLVYDQPVLNESVNTLA